MSLLNFKKEKSKKTTGVTIPASTHVEPDFRKSHPFSGRVFIKQPWASEKAHRASRENKYIFLVNIEANKPIVAKEIERRYGVKVKDVNIIKQKGKVKRLGRQLGRRSDFKKAIITLKAGDKIEIS